MQKKKTKNATTGEISCLDQEMSQIKKFLMFSQQFWSIPMPDRNAGVAAKPKDKASSIDFNKELIV
jgi:hypothetical protein